MKDFSSLPYNHIVICSSTAATALREHSMIIQQRKSFDAIIRNQKKEETTANFEDYMSNKPLKNQDEHGSILILSFTSLMKFINFN